MLLQNSPLLKTVRPRAISMPACMLCVLVAAIVCPRSTVAADEVAFELLGLPGAIGHSVRAYSASGSTVAGSSYFSERPSAAYLRITVVDSHPPIAVVTTDVGLLWPANNKMLPVQIRVSATDACANPDSLQVLCFVSSNPADGTGDLAGDVDGQDGFTHPVPVQLTGLGNGLYAATVTLRAERDGQDKSGRVYSINLQAADPSGTWGYASTAVVVPHSQSKGNRP